MGSVVGGQGAAAFEGAGEGEFVGVFEAGAGREALGDAGDADAEGGEAFGEVGAGGLALDVAAEGEDNLLDALGGNAGLEGIDAKVFRSHAIEGTDASAEGVVASAVGAGFLEAEDVEGAFDDAKDAVGAGRVGAEGAGLGLGEGAAGFAGGDAFAGGDEHVGEGTDERGIGLHEVQGEAFGGAGPDAGESPEGGGQGDDRFGKGGHGSGLRRGRAG